MNLSKSEAKNLKNSILDFVLQKGKDCFTIEEICKEFNCKYTFVRDRLKEMAQKGILISEPGGACRKEKFYLSSIKLSSIKLIEKEIEEIYTEISIEKQKIKDLELAKKHLLTR